MFYILTVQTYLNDWVECANITVQTYLNDWVECANITVQTYLNDWVECANMRHFLSLCSISGQSSVYIVLATVLCPYFDC